ncbi:MAG: NUDIX hydrolase [Promethearchaeota archaeon]
MEHSEDSDRVNVVALIVRKNGEVLLERRKKDRKVDPGKLVIPEGHVEDTETQEQACKRELKEELDLECSKFRHVISIPHDTTSEKQMVHYCARTRKQLDQRTWFSDPAQVHGSRTE